MSNNLRLVIYRAVTYLIYMNVFFIITAILAGLATAGALGVGLFAMVRGGEFNKKHGNKLMQLRVIFQGLALTMLALAYFSSQS